jgi:multidrug efflux pump subunit AcrA (membrane-fusion protein)
MNKKIRWWIIGLIVLIAVIIGLKKAGFIGKDQTTKVALEKVEARTIVETVNATGKIYPEKEVKISPDVSGEITELNVKEGDHVQKGEILARISGHSINIMQQPIETHATLTAPMDGVISFLSAKKGERAAGTTNMMGSEMIRVADFSHFEMRVDVAENDISKVEVGDSASVSVDAFTDKKVKGIVTQIASSPNSPTMGLGNDVTNYKVYIRILSGNKENSTYVQNTTFRPGMTGSADIQTKTKQNVLAVPINSVTTRNKNDDLKANTEKVDGDSSPSEGDINQLVVFVYQQNGAIKKMVVKTGLQDTKYIEITDGLKGGEQVVSDPYTTISTILKDGMKVKVVAKDKLFMDKTTQ